MGRVTVTAASGAFEGQGQAWMNVEDLAAFAAALGEYPIPDDMPRFAGGYVGYETVSVTVMPFDAKGLLVVCAKLATEDMPSAEAPNLHENATVRFVAEYAGLQRFSTALATVAKAQTGEAILIGAS